MKKATVRCPLRCLICINTFFIFIFFLTALLLPVISVISFAEAGEIGEIGNDGEVAHNMREIPVTDIGSICIGQTENAVAATGCTVFIAPNGMRAGLDVRGGGPASRAG